MVMSSFVVIDTETTWRDEVMSVGAVIADSAVTVQSSHTDRPEPSCASRLFAQLYWKDRGTFHIRQSSGV